MLIHIVQENNNIQEILKEISNKGFLITKPIKTESKALIGISIELGFGYRLQDMLWEYYGGKKDAVNFTLEEFKELDLKVLDKKQGERNVIVGDIYNKNSKIIVVLSESEITNLETGEEIFCDEKDFDFGKLWGNYYYFLNQKKELVFPVQLQKLLF